MSVCITLEDDIDISRDMIVEKIINQKLNKILILWYAG